MSESRLWPGWVTPYAAPDGWRNVRLSDVAQTIAGGRLGLTKERNYQSSGVAAYSAAGQDGYVGVAEYDDHDAVILASVGAHCGKCFLAEGRWTTLANVQAILVSAQLNARFLLYRVDRDDYWPRSGTAQPFIKPSEIARCWLSLPPLPEQQKIAEILDALDETIRKTDQIIAKLKQAKQGLLHDLLTRGLDDGGELRDPERHPEQFKDRPLGRIPKAWSAAELGQLAVLITSGSRGWARFYAQTGALFIRSQNVRMGRLDLSDEQRVQVQVDEGQRTRLASHDLLITITGNGVGNIAMVPAPWQETAFVSQHVGLVRLKDADLAPLAMHYLVQGAPGHRQLLDAQYGQSKPGLNLDNLRGLIIPVPDRRERKRIVERLSCAQERINNEIHVSSKLRLLKLGLMEDLLTGRIRTTNLLEP